MDELVRSIRWPARREKDEILRPDARMACDQRAGRLCIGHASQAFSRAAFTGF